MPASGEFRLSISRALTDQLKEHLATLTPAALSPDTLARLDKRQGVYQLYKRDQLVYVGSASGTLPHRLGQHLRKVSGRQNITVDEMSFTCLYVDEDLTVLAPEERLIRAFQGEGAAPWNTNGFGNNDPGRRRDESHVSDNHFDSLYPINLDWPCDSIAAGDHRGDELLAGLKRTLPFVLRYENTAHAKLVYQDVEIRVPSTGMTAEALLELVAEALPGYQMTALPGYVILYQEERNYPSGRIIRMDG